MQNAKDTSLTGLAMISLGLVGELLKSSQVLEAVIAALVGFGLLFYKYHTRSGM